MHDLGTLGGTQSVAYGLNGSGRATGYSVTAGGTTHAFLYDGSIHDLGTLGGPISEGQAVNDSLQVTGFADLPGSVPGPNRVYHAFLYDGTMHDLGTLGGTLSGGNGINSAGLVTGFSYYSTASTLEHAFLYDGTMHDLGTLGGANSMGYGVNSSGQVTGYSLTSTSTGFHAFLYTAETGMLDLNNLIDPASGWQLVGGTSINDAGQVTGVGRIGGELHAFLATPVPEPASLIPMAAVGLALLTIVRWTRLC
jgi:probable HAF family extracellular repeat protein